MLYPDPERHNNATTTEPSANNALANILRGMMHGCNIRSESTQTIAGNKALQPDILITAADRAPVVIEAEFMPAYSVEDEAAARLALTVTGGRREIEAVIALRYPAGLEDAYDLTSELKPARLSYCVLTAPEDNDSDFDRFPESGWLEGYPADVAELARLVSVPQSAVNAAASTLENGIDSAVGVLNEMEKQPPVAAHELPTFLECPKSPRHAAWLALSWRTQWSFTTASHTCTPKSFRSIGYGAPAPTTRRARSQTHGTGFWR